MVDELLAQHRLRAADCDAFAFGAGPGSFTGLRIACGLAQGLGFATQRAVVPVDCLAATARHARRVAGDTGEHGVGFAVAVAIDARMDEVYFGLDDGDGQDSLARTFGVGPAGHAASVLGDRRRARQAQRAPAVKRPLLCAGDGFERYAAALAPLVADADAVMGSAHARADAIALLGAEALATGQAFAAADAAPRYVRDKVALDVDEQHALRAARAALVSP